MPGRFDKIVRELGRLLKDKGWKLALAESCTGGMISARITDMPGSSSFFYGGVVSYQNWVKYKVLGVPNEELAEHGAVSPQVALSMASGVKKLMKTDIALSVTGIAGPDGGTPEKPVGLVFMAIDGLWGPRVEKLQLDGKRGEIRTAAAFMALKLLCEYVQNNKVELT